MKRSRNAATAVGTVNKPVSSPNPTPEPNFFNAPHRAQTNRQAQVQLSVDPAYFLLMTALLSELKTQNALVMEKMKLEASQKQEELEAAQAEQVEDQKRFEEIAPSRYL